MHLNTLTNVCVGPTGHLYLLAAALGLAGATLVPADLVSWNSDFAGGGVVPDGGLTGWSDTRSLSGYTGTITDLNVTLNLAGGYNGDYYAYLTHDSGFTVLLNRVGRTGSDAMGYGEAGLKVKLDDSASHGDIHLYANVAGFSGLISGSGSFQPDGRAAGPLLAVNTDARDRLLNQFNGLSPNGAWTLFVGDVSSGEQGMVAGWGLELTTAATPEPSSGLMAVLLGVGAGAAALARRRAQAPPKASPIISDRIGL